MFALKPRTNQTLVRFQEDGFSGDCKRLQKAINKAKGKKAPAATSSGKVTKRYKKQRTFNTPAAGSAASIPVSALAPLLVSTGSSGSKPKPPVTCHNCNKLGHYARDCRATATK